MLTDLIFYEPHEQARFRPKTAQALPQLCVAVNGSFRFNAEASEMLSLHVGALVLLGHRRDDAREWYLMRVKEGGWPLRDLSAGGRPASSLGFYSQELRHQLRAALPHAPEGRSLHLKLDALTILEESGAEIWPLLTAPYYVPPEAQAPKPEAPVHRRVLALTMPGLLGVLHAADLP